MKKEIITSENIAKPMAPYAPAVRVKAAGSMIFTAGAAPCDLSGNIIHPGDILAQAKITVKNLIAALEAAGAKPEQVVKTTTYVVSSSIKDFFETKAFLECLAPFKEPADTLVGVASLVGSEQGQLIEIDAVAFID